MEATLKLSWKKALLIKKACMWDLVLCELSKSAKLLVLCFNQATVFFLVKGLERFNQNPVKHSKRYVLDIREGS